MLAPTQMLLKRQQTRIQRHRARKPSHIRHHVRYNTPPSNIPLIKQISSTPSSASRNQLKRQVARHSRRVEASKLHFEEKAATQKQWAKVAAETERIVRGTGQYIEDDVAQGSSNALQIGEPSFSSFSQVVHDISPQVQLSRQLSSFYPHYSDLLANWRSVSSSAGSSHTNIEFASASALNVARDITIQNPHLTSPASSSSLPSTRVGVLSFASPKKPKGGISHGGEEQVDSIIRSSSLISSLLDSSAGSLFYEEHKKYWREDGSGLHDHGMLYSPGVVVFRNDEKVATREDDEYDHVVSLSSHFADTDHSASRSSTSEATGRFISPYTVNVLSAVPVSAGVIRTKHVILPEDKQLFEGGIRSAMKERMARTLKLFEERGDKVVVLGAFGCGCSSQNSIESVASIWAELLVCGDRDLGTRNEPRFKNVFEKVVFAVPGKSFFPFKDAFDMRLFEEELSMAAMDD